MRKNLPDSETFEVNNVLKSSNHCSRVNTRPGHLSRIRPFDFGGLFELETRYCSLRRVKVEFSSKQHGKQVSLKHGIMNLGGKTTKIWINQRIYQIWPRVTFSNRSISQCICDRKTKRNMEMCLWKVFVKQTYLTHEEYFEANKTNIDKQLNMLDSGFLEIIHYFSVYIL